MVDSSQETAAPKVSIGMPVFNGERFLAEAIESALGQDFEDFELIVADNASTDRTPEIVRDYAAKVPRIKFVRHPKNIGAARNYNYVFGCASGEYFNWLAHDDILRPGFLSVCLQGFAAYGNEPVLVYPQFSLVDENLRELERQSAFVHAVDDSPLKRLRNTLDGLALVTSIFGLFRREALARTRLIGSFTSSDYVLLVECALLGKIVRLPGEPQFLRRFHARTSRSANRTKEAVAKWFDPDATADARPTRRLSHEYLKAVFTLDGLSYRDRLLIVAYLQSRRVRGRTQREVRRLLRASA